MKMPFSRLTERHYPVCPGFFCLDYQHHSVELLERAWLLALAVPKSFRSRYATHSLHHTYLRGESR
jgi:hypothetical protein